MPRSIWKGVAVSIPGFGHQDNGLPCQDHHKFRIFDDWLIGAISDGAGTAANARDGAAAICTAIVDKIFDELSWTPPRPGTDMAVQIRQWVETGIESVRDELMTDGTNPLASFNATLVGVVANGQGGVFFHIGDGAGLAIASRNFGSYIISGPENGEYTDETYFFTDHEWQRHLRITSFSGEYDLITLMTDGVTPFALTNGANGPHAPFLKPVSRYLASCTREAGEIALADTLNQMAIRRITNDDKTLVWALRNDECA
jgi:hypothetical protein